MPFVVTKSLYYGIQEGGVSIQKSLIFGILRQHDHLPT